jgi:hypothetical protein
MSSITVESILRKVGARMPFEKSPKAIIFGGDAPMTSTSKGKRLKHQA